VDTLIVSRCTFVDNERECVALSATGRALVKDSIIAHNSGSAVEGDLVTTTHSCIFGNTEGDSLQGTHFENLFTWPLFCNHESGDLTLRDDSPCLPANNPWGVHMGAYGAGDCGTSVDEILLPGDIRIDAVRPNPAGRAGTQVHLAAPPGAMIEMRVFDVRGRLIRTLAGSSSVRDQADIVWDHCDERGAPVASGVYFVEASGGGRVSDRAKVIVLR
jgi:hypothetical protein